MLGVPVQDLTGGFKCFRREVLETVTWTGPRRRLWLPDRADLPGDPSGFRVIEVPITFRDRRAGKSKMSARIAVEAVWKVPALKLRAR